MLCGADTQETDPDLPLAAEQGAHGLAVVPQLCADLGRLSETLHRNSVFMELSPMEHPRD